MRCEGFSEKEGNKKLKFKMFDPFLILSQHYHICLVYFDQD